MAGRPQNQLFMVRGLCGNRFAWLRIDGIEVGRAHKSARNLPQHSIMAITSACVWPSRARGGGVRIRRKFEAALSRRAPQALAAAPEARAGGGMVLFPLSNCTGRKRW